MQNIFLIDRRVRWILQGLTKISYSSFNMLGISKLRSKFMHFCASCMSALCGPSLSTHTLILLPTASWGGCGQVLEGIYFQIKAFCISIAEMCSGPAQVECGAVIWMLHQQLLTKEHDIAFQCRRLVCTLYIGAGYMEQSRLRLLKWNNFVALFFGARRLNPEHVLTNSLIK
jgi:hypothetical protein